MMEPEVKDFLKRIVWSVGLGFFWLMLTLGIGTYNNLLVPPNGITLGVILFYAWFVSSFIALIWIFFRIWRKKFPHG